MVCIHGNNASKSCGLRSEIPFSMVPEISGEVLRVGLSAGKIWTEETEKYTGEYIGGRAIISLIL